MVDAETLDLSKENIQPLRHGRKTHMLGLALQAQTDDGIHQQLLKERDEYELLIRVYDGPDPLKPRYDYIFWLEQSYPKHGRESNLIPLLEDTITIFKDDERYIQDLRFVELIIKFIATQVNPLELYQVVYNLGIGTKCSLFYKSWADELDQSGDVKRADQIFSLGISNGAMPLETLRQDHKQFQLSVGRRLLHGEELAQPGSYNQDNDQAPSRQALGKLRSKVGSSRPTHGRAGVVPLCLSNRNLPQKSNAPMTVYVDDESTNLTISNVENYQVEQLPKSDLSKKENSLKPGPWTKAYKTHKTPQYHHQVYTPTTPSFKVHEDFENIPATPMSVCPSALKTRKGDTFQCPVAVFEPPDPSVRPMYCKSKIYVGGREFQFEEVQTAMYYKKQREKTQKEELEKLGLKLADTCLTTPQATRRENKEVDYLKTPCTTSKPKIELVTPLCETPYQPSSSDANFQPITPFDLPSLAINEVTMLGAETITKTSQVTSSNLDNKKPPETTSLAKKSLKFPNFQVYCDDN